MHVVTLSNDNGEPTPVGVEYIEEKCNESGKAIQFNCKLCDCKFSDPNAKEMHLKGRRHRLQYKKKVDPDLEVDIKPSIRARRIQEEISRRQMHKGELKNFHNMHEPKHEMQQMEWINYGGQAVQMGHLPFGRSTNGLHKMKTSDDCHAIAKHSHIYPAEMELHAIQMLVSFCEKALKSVSDIIAAEDAAAPKNDTDSHTHFFDNNDGLKAASKAITQPRLLKGVTRVGLLAKGLLLRGDYDVALVLQCAEKPTGVLLQRVVRLIEPQLIILAGQQESSALEQSYTVKAVPELAGIVVTGKGNITTTCTITLTSSAFHTDPSIPTTTTAAAAEQETQAESEDLLNQSHCMEALAQLRHAKWFEAKARGLHNCVITNRLMRDLCQRVPTWSPLCQWAVELLVEKCIASDGTRLAPGDALRRVFECVASGIMLSSGPGIVDPCENELTDAAGSLTAQEREDITASAQHALRLIAFRQIHKVLGMDSLSTSKVDSKKGMKRRHSETVPEVVDEKALTECDLIVS